MVGRRRPDARAAPAARCRHHGASRCGGGGGRIADPIRPAGAASMLHVLILSLSLKPGRMPPPARQRPVSMTATLGEKDVAELLSGKEYAMDISSITEGSEKETYIGQGSGVNAGTGIGALAGWVKGLVGKYLARKNRPVYEDLWQIIEGDLLTMVQEHEPALEQRRTWFTEPGDAPAAHTFATADGKCEGTVAAYKGGRVDWITTCKFFSSELGFGNLRIDGWATRAPLPGSLGPRTGRSIDTYLFSSAPELPLAHSRACLARVPATPHTLALSFPLDGPGETRAPHVAVHLCIVFNVLFIYIGMPPRTNLVLDDAYNDHVYGAPRASIGGALTARVHACVDTQSEGSDTAALSGHVPLSLSPLSNHVSRTCSPAPDPTPTRQVAKRHACRVRRE